MSQNQTGATLLQLAIELYLKLISSYVYISILYCHCFIDEISTTTTKCFGDDKNCLNKIQKLLRMWSIIVYKE